jgi:ribosomal protein S18 acetylase RimI-like enzyme
VCARFEQCVQECGRLTFTLTFTELDRSPLKLHEDYELLLETPAAEEYRRLRVTAGMSAKSAEAAARGLPNTIFAVCIRKAGELVGMGRVTGDGGLFYQINDIAVDPAHQGRGLGKAVVGRLVEHINSAAPSTAFVSLIADGEAHRLYAQYGFEPTAPASIGMAYEID